MKKNAVIALAIMVVGMAQAVQLNWAITGVQKDESGATLSGGLVALVMGTPGSTASSISYSWDGTNWSITGGQLISVANLNAGGNFTGTTGFVVGGGGVWGTDNLTGGVDFDGNATSVKSQGIGAGNATPYYMIVFDSDNKSGNYTVIGLAGTGSITIAGAANNGTVAYGTGIVAGPSSTWTAIPEPTSMALLALGAAAFGLRRRFRK